MLGMDGTATPPLTVASSSYAHLFITLILRVSTLVRFISMGIHDTAIKSDWPYYVS